MTEQNTENQPDQMDLVQTPVVVEDRKSKPLTIAILLVVILLIVTGAVYAGMQIGKKQVGVWVEPPLTVATPQPTGISDETASWKTYKNEKYGFEFLYRPDLTIKEEKDFILLLYYGEPYERLFSAKIYVIDNPNNYTPAIYAEKELCKNAVKIPDVGDTKDYCVKLVKDNLKMYKNNKIEGIKTIYNLYENPTFVVIFNNNNKLIQLSSSGETGSLPTEMGLQTIDQILSTFKFID